MEHFPERDGNYKPCRGGQRRIQLCPNGALPWKGWKRCLFWFRWFVSGFVRMEHFPERDGNTSSFCGLNGCIFSVRMEHFPERDGNRCSRNSLRSDSEILSEWSTSLKGMETVFIALDCLAICLNVRMEVFPERDGNSISSFIARFNIESSPNGGLPWKGWKPRRPS